MKWNQNTDSIRRVFFEWEYTLAECLPVVRDTRQRRSPATIHQLCEHNSATEISYLGDYSQSWNWRVLTGNMAGLWPKKTATLGIDQCQSLPSNAPSSATWVAASSDQLDTCGIVAHVSFTCFCLFFPHHATLSDDNEITNFQVTLKEIYSLNQLPYCTKRKTLICTVITVFCIFKT